MPAMTSRERVLAAIRCQPVDYVPCAPFLNNQDWPQRLGRRWQFPFGPSRPEMLDYAVTVLGLDQVVTFDWGYFPEPGVSSRTWVDAGVLYKQFATPSGELQAAVRLDGGWPHGFDLPFFSDYNPVHFVEPWIKTLDDVACLGHILRPPATESDLAQVRFDVADCRHWADRYGLATCFYFGLGLTGALDMMGAEALCTLAVDAPELIDAYLEVDHRWNLASYQLALELGVDFVRRNGFYETADFFSPQLLQRFLAERLAREAALVHQAGRPIGYTLLSGYAPILDYLGPLGFDCLICPDIFLRDGNAALLRAKLGDRMSFWTGPSDTVHLPWENPAAVRDAVYEVFEAFGPTGLLITPCSSAKSVFPWANVLAMIEAWRERRQGSPAH